MRRALATEVPLEQALGRVAAADVASAIALPPFDNSAMDGYAVRASDLEFASPDRAVRLRVTGKASAGHPAGNAVENGSAHRIMTGAPVPAGAEAVVPQEATRAEGDNVWFTAPARVGAHIRRRGEDAAAGAIVVAAGTLLGARHLAAVASTGAATVSVAAPPRVAVLVTGDELTPPGSELAHGGIYDSNSVYVAAALTALGAQVVSVGRCGDDADAVRAWVTSADADLVVTTGGASVGEHDPVKAALLPLGVDFTNVAMQPGKPQGIGVANGVPVLCLPGNPVAVAISTELFVARAVRAMVGLAEPAWVPMLAGSSWTCPRGREQIMPVVFEGDAVIPATAGGSGSHLVARLGVAEAMARVPADVDAVSAGDSVLVRRFHT